MPVAETDIPVWIDAAAQAIVAITAVIAVIPAVKGLNAWRTELAGTDKYQTVRKALKVLYALDRSVKATRSPLRTLDLEKLQGLPQPLSHEQTVETVRRDYEAGLDRVRERLRELSDVEVDIRIVFGDEAVTALMPLNELAQNLMLDADEYFALKRMDAAAPLGEAHRKEMRQYRRTAYRGKDDEFGPKWDGAMEQARDAFRARANLR